MDINSPLPPRENCWLAWKAEGNLGRRLGSVGSDGTEGWGLEWGSCWLGGKQLSQQEGAALGSPFPREAVSGGAEGLSCS